MQIFNQYWAKVEGYTHNAKFYDVHNAFYCVPRGEHMQTWLDQSGGDFPAQMHDQLLDNCLSVKECADGVLIVSAPTGVAPG